METKSFSQLSLLLQDSFGFLGFCRFPSVSSEELAFPRLIRCELSRLCCHGHSLLLTSYLCRIKRKENSCSACRHPLQDLTHLLLDCPASKPFRRAIFGTTSSIWSRPWGVAQLLGLRGVPPRPPLSKGSGSTTTMSNELETLRVRVRCVTAALSLHPAAIVILFLTTKDEMTMTQIHKF